MDELSWARRRVKGTRPFVVAESFPFGGAALWFLGEFIEYNLFL